LSVFVGVTTEFDPSNRIKCILAQNLAMKKLFSILVLLVVIASCSSLQTSYDYDRSVNFTEFKTFSFYPWDYKNGFQINDYDKQTILDAIQSSMEKKGYAYQEKGGDLAVSLFITIKGKTSYDAYTNHYGGWAGYGGGWGYNGFGYGYGYGPGFSTTTVTENHYDQGTLVIDVFSMKDKKLVWQGIGSKPVEQNLDVRDRTLPKNVARIMSKLPANK